jgi:hypothetical protein
MISEESNADKEMSWHIRDHWLFDADDEPSVGPDGPDEKDRVLVDEFHPKYVLFYSSQYEHATGCVAFSSVVRVCDLGDPN